MPVTLDRALTPPSVRLVTRRYLLNEASASRDPVPAGFGHCRCKDVRWLFLSVLDAYEKTMTSSSLREPDTFKGISRSSS